MISRRKFLGTGTAAAVSGAAGRAVGATSASALANTAAETKLADTVAHSVGRAKVPAFKPSRAGTYTIQLATADGKAFYLKVTVAAKKASSASKKPASSSSKAPVKTTGKQG